LETHHLQQLFFFTFIGALADKGVLKKPRPYGAVYVRNESTCLASRRNICL